jgi:hypothetical protein
MNELVYKAFKAAVAADSDYSIILEKHYQSPGDARYIFNHNIPDLDAAANAKLAADQAYYNAVKLNGGH